MEYNNNYHMRMDIPFFDGQFEIEEFFEWLDEVEYYFEYMDIEEDIKVKLVANKLRSGASIWWEQLQASRVRQGRRRIRSWAQMRLMLKFRFLPENYEDILFEKYQRCRQGRRTVHEYATRFQKLSTWNNLAESEEQLVTKFLYGLRDDIHDFVPLKPFDAIQDAILSAKFVEFQLKYRCPTTTRSYNPISIRTSDINSNHILNSSSSPSLNQALNHSPTRGLQEKVVTNNPIVCKENTYPTIIVRRDEGIPISEEVQEIKETEKEEIIVESSITTCDKLKQVIEVRKTSIFVDAIFEDSYNLDQLFLEENKIIIDLQEEVIENPTIFQEEQIKNPTPLEVIDPFGDEHYNLDLLFDGEEIGSINLQIVEVKDESALKFIGVDRNYIEKLWVNVTKFFSHEELFEELFAENKNRALSRVKMKIIPKLELYILLSATEIALKVVAYDGPLKFFFSPLDNSRTSYF